MDNVAMPTQHEPLRVSSRSSSRPESVEIPGSRGARPGLGGRKSSGSIIIPRDSPTVEIREEQYDAGDARAMSPRRGSDEIERMGDEARAALEQQARALQENLNEIMTRVESVRSEHEKLDGGNKFLQSYIGELMQTSKIATTGAGKPKPRGRSNK